MTESVICVGDDDELLLEELELAISLGNTVIRSLEVYAVDVTDLFSESEARDLSILEEGSFNEPVNVVVKSKDETVSVAVLDGKLLAFAVDNEVVSVALAYNLEDVKDEKELVIELIEASIIVLRSIVTVEVLFWQDP